MPATPRPSSKPLGHSASHAVVGAEALVGLGQEHIDDAGERIAPAASRSAAGAADQWIKHSATQARYSR